jgi:hypothetical protein
VRNRRSSWGERTRRAFNLFKYLSRAQPLNLDFVLLHATSDQSINQQFSALKSCPMIMDNELSSNPPNAEPSFPSPQEAHSSTQSENPPQSPLDRDFLKEKPPPPDREYSHSIDESQDTTTFRTSTRLVKFQLFETKSVFSPS